MVAPPGLEPGLFALRGRRVNQLHHNARTVYSQEDILSSAPLKYSKQQPRTQGSAIRGSVSVSRIVQSKQNASNRAPKARCIPAQGIALGFARPRDCYAPCRGAGPSALSGRKIQFGRDTRGVAPGLHPPRRWRENLNLSGFVLWVGPSGPTRRVTVRGAFKP